MGGYQKLKFDFFISHAREDLTLATQLFETLGKSEHQVFLASKSLQLGDRWREEIKDAIATSRIIVLLISSHTSKSHYQNEEINFATAIATRRPDKHRIAPIYLDRQPPEGEFGLRSIHSLFLGDSGGLDAVVAELERMLLITCNSPVKEKVSLARLPITSGPFLGRIEWLELLDAAWDDPATRIVTCVAFGGVGKSALVNHWLNGMADEKFRGAQCVFGWSFHTQGNTNFPTSSDLFINRALAFFGDAAPEAGDPDQKVERLANLIRDSRALLILDGIEPLQDASRGNIGKLQDRALAMLTRELAFKMNGLCVLTSRLEVEDLAQFSAPAVRLIKLEDLNLGIGSNLLREYGVKGPDIELRNAVKEYHGHALSLTLLANYLVDTADGDVVGRSQIKLLSLGDAASHANSVMNAYDDWLRDGEREIVRLVSLFDRPIAETLLKGFRNPPTIQGATQGIRGLSEQEWAQSIHRLRKARLILPSSNANPDSIDVHPIVREYFGTLLHNEAPSAWLEANYRIYCLLKDSVPRQPKTAEEIEPLFQAVRHGCQAGRYEEVFKEVFWPRIRRRKKSFSTKKLGAWGNDLAALANFFDCPWTVPVRSLSAGTRVRVIGEAGLDLRALGRLRESIPLLREALEMHRIANEWDDAAIRAGNLCKVHIALGQISDAETIAREAVELANYAGDPFRATVCHAKLARTLHLQGKFEEAAREFNEAEKCQQRCKGRPLRYGARSAWHAAFLLDTGDFNGAYERALYTLRYVRKRNWFHDIGIAHLSLGQAMKTIEKGTASTIRRHFDQAIVYLRRAGQTDTIPYALVARASLFCSKNEIEAAEQDLQNALEIAQRSEMRLHEADARILETKLALLNGDCSRGRVALGEASAIVNACNYGLRRSEIAQLDRRVRRLCESSGERVKGGRKRRR